MEELPVLDHSKQVIRWVTAIPRVRETTVSTVSTVSIGSSDSIQKPTLNLIKCGPTALERLVDLAGKACSISIAAQRDLIGR
jgi:hypothetical protein